MKNSQKGFILQAGFIIASTLLVVTGYLYLQNKKVVDANSPFKDPIFFEKSTADTTSCDRIFFRPNVYGVNEAKSDKSVCYSNMAVELNDTAICNKMIPLGEGLSPFQCYSAIARKQGNLNLCNILPDDRGNDSKYSCYSLIGGDKADYSICNMIPENSPSSDEKRHCMFSAALVKGECDALKDIDRDACYQYQSESVRYSAKENICEKDYTEPKILALCQKYVNKEITIQEDCGRIVDPTIQKQCMNFNVNSVKRITQEELDQQPKMR